MSFQDSYKKYLTKRGGSVKGSMTKTFIREASRLMKTNPSYDEVIINNSPSPTPSLVVDDSKSEDLKHISLAPSYVLQRGDYIQWDDKTWLTLIVDHQGNIYYRGRIAQCSSENLKWVDDNDQVQFFPCVFHYGAKANFGVFSDKVMTMPDGRRQVIVQKNEHTTKIVRDMRFMFGGNVFTVIDHDCVSENGLVHLNLKDDLFNPARDNKELGIADYYKSLVSYEVEILNGNFDMQIGQSLKLNIIAKRDGEVVSNPPLTFTSTDTSILTVDDTGEIEAISEGSAEVYVQYQSGQSSIVVNVVSIPVEDDYSIVIVSTSDKPNEIKKNQQKQYVAEVYKNGVLATNEPVSWKLYADDQISNTSLAKIINETDTVCTIKNNDSVSGYIQLKAVLQRDNSIEKWTRIQMRNLF
ncbi:Ig-like domain-containing protein [Heyndrickxia oleronia]|jgi:hypothetical protein|uniref:Ig-like domain-containing protein n=1 Tax=Heyndrickxia oleronia TaxID=38875 RepID=UPI00242B5FD7|nr:hypothetical protein [Heyndrickxia oleronia]MCI1763640.1 hypothetical protein [Heyndrickxia oleronia]